MECYFLSRPIDEERKQKKIQKTNAWYLKGSTGFESNRAKVV